MRSAKLANIGRPAKPSVSIPRGRFQQSYRAPPVPLYKIAASFYCPWKQQVTLVLVLTSRNWLGSSEGFPGNYLQALAHCRGIGFNEEPWYLLQPSTRMESALLFCAHVVNYQSTQIS